MSLGDLIGAGIFGGFGLWWAVFPNSVVTFYTWFHGGRIRAFPRQHIIRLIGILWIALVLSVAMLQTHPVLK